MKTLTARRGISSGGSWTLLAGHGEFRRIMSVCIAGCMMASCATQPEPAENSVNRALNQGGQAVSGRIDDMNRSTIRALGRSLPVCIAYQLPSRPPILNATLADTLADLTISIRQPEAPPHRFVVYHAQQKGGIDPLGELILLEKQLPGLYRHARMEYFPMPPPEFRKRAKCPSKDTILIAGDNVQFYRTELPLATLATGEMRIDSVLFMVLESAAQSTAAKLTHEGSPL